jgi:hypothetical protein
MTAMMVRLCLDGHPKLGLAERRRRGTHEAYSEAYHFNKSRTTLMQDYLPLTLQSFLATHERTINGDHQLASRHSENSCAPCGWKTVRLPIAGRYFFQQFLVRGGQRRPNCLSTGQ